MKPDKQIRYEKRDVAVGPVVWIGLAIGVVSLVAALVLIPFFRLLESRSTRSDPVAPPMAQRDPGQRPPEPRLQVLPFEDIESLRAEESAILQSYGWVDEQAGIVRLPIEEAMRILSEKGLPARTDSSGSPPEGSGSTERQVQ